MSALSGTQVPTGSRRTRPASDLARLLTYMETGFVQRRQALLDLLGETEQLASRGDLVKLGVRSLRMASELDGWIEIARDAIDNAKGSELESSRQLTEGDTGGRRAPADEVKAKAAANMSPLTTIHQVLKAFRDRCLGMNRWAQILLQSLREMEFGEMLEQDADLAPMFDAPLTDTISRADANII